MFAAFMIALAPAAAQVPAAPMIPREMPMIREPRVAGPTALEWHTLSQPHPKSDDRMFPDIAVKDMRIDGDTLYVRLVNQGRGSARTPIMVVARAAENGMKTDEVQLRTDRLAAGESRWVPLKGFSVKSASVTAPVFDLASASAVSAAAWLLPSTAGALDRSGQSCGECATDSDTSNNLLTLQGNSIKHSGLISTNGG
jgi:hypothetical protein